MSTDAQGREPEPPPRDLRRLPDVLDVEVTRVRYRSPLVRYTGPNDTVEYDQAVELLVTTSEPFPIRAIPPVLYVGEQLVDDWEQVASTRYRFYAFRIGDLQDGATIRLGWPDEPDAAADTGHRFQSPREETR
jgi:hypothetical protein